MDQEYMKRAICVSQEAVDAGQMPFGAVCVYGGKIHCEASNKVLADGGDCTSHAETNLVRLFTCGAKAIPRNERSKATVYTSAEPCVMCAGALVWSGVGRVVFGCTAAEMTKLSGPGGFDIPVRELYKQSPRPVEVEGPLLEKEALAVHALFWGKSGVVRGGGGGAPPQAPPPSDTVGTDVALERSLRGGFGASEARVDPGMSVPTIDMSLGDEAVADAMWEAATTWGFFSVVGHGIPEELINESFSASEQFFAQPVDAKEKSSPFAKELNSGFEYMSQVRPSTGTPDQKESLQITARGRCMEGRWPSHPANFHPQVYALTAASRDLAARILNILEPRACPTLPQGTLAGSHNLWTDDGQCTLRLLHYMEMDKEARAKMPEGYWRAGAHTDWDCVTLLFQRPGNEGLECARNPKMAGTGGAAGWVPVNPVPGGIAINIGDMLARWSNGRLFSNLHRVRLPTPEECDPPRPRYSIAFFMQADKGAMIRSEGHDPITAGEYILGRIKSNFAK